MNALLIIVVVIAFVIFGPKIIASLKTVTAVAPAANGTQKTNVKVTNGESDIDVSGKGACACSNGVCKGDCNDGSSLNKSCACQNGKCVGDCSDGMKIDPATFDPMEWVKQHS